MSGYDSAGGSKSKKSKKKLRKTKDAADDAGGAGKDTGSAKSEKKKKRKDTSSSKSKKTKPSSSASSAKGKRKKSSSSSKAKRRAADAAKNADDVPTSEDDIDDDDNEFDDNRGVFAQPPRSVPHGPNSLEEFEFVYGKDLSKERLQNATIQQLPNGVVHSPQATHPIASSNSPPPSSAGGSPPHAPNRRTPSPPALASTSTQLMYNAPRQYSVLPQRRRSLAATGGGGSSDEDNNPPSHNNNSAGNAGGGSTGNQQQLMSNSFSDLGSYKDGYDSDTSEGISLAELSKRVKEEEKRKKKESKKAKKNEKKLQKSNNKRKSAANQHDDDDDMIGTESEKGSSLSLKRTRKKKDKNKAKNKRTAKQGGASKSSKKNNDHSSPVATSPAGDGSSTPVDNTANSGGVAQSPTLQQQQQQTRLSATRVPTGMEVFVYGKGIEERRAEAARAAKPRAITDAPLMLTKSDDSVAGSAAKPHVPVLKKFNTDLNITAHSAKNKVVPRNTAQKLAAIAGKDDRDTETEDSDESEDNESDESEGEDSSESDHYKDVDSTTDEDDQSEDDEDDDSQSEDDEDDEDDEGEDDPSSEARRRRASKQMQRQRRREQQEKHRIKRALQQQQRIAALEQQLRGSGGSTPTSTRGAHVNQNLSTRPVRTVSKKSDAQARTAAKDAAVYMSAERFHQTKAMLDNEKKRLVEEKKRFEEEKRQWEERKRQAGYVWNDLQHIVTLNVGGQQFGTTLKTLAAYPNSLLSMLYTQDRVRSEVFIDRDPKHFGRLLNFMRTKKVVWPSDPAEREEFMLDCEYYKMKDEVCTAGRRDYFARLIGALGVSPLEYDEDFKRISFVIEAPLPLAVSLELTDHFPCDGPVMHVDALFFGPSWDPVKEPLVTISSSSSHPPTNVLMVTPINAAAPSSMGGASFSPPTSKTTSPTASMSCSPPPSPASSAIALPLLSSTNPSALSSPSADNAVSASLALLARPGKRQRIYANFLNSYGCDIDRLARLTRSFLATHLHAIAKAIYYEDEYAPSAASHSASTPSTSPLSSGRSSPAPVTASSSPSPIRTGSSSPSLRPSSSGVSSIYSPSPQSHVIRQTASFSPSTQQRHQPQSPMASQQRTVNRRASYGADVSRRVVVASRNN